jgi:hypothetical protein
MAALMAANPVTWERATCLVKPCAIRCCCPMWGTELSALDASLAAYVDFETLRDARLTAGRTDRKLVGWALHAERAAAEDVGIHHRSADVLVTE